MYRTRPMTRDEALSNAAGRAVTVTQDGEVVSFDRTVFKGALTKAGFVIVPLEPTRAMILAAERHAEGDAMIRAAYAAYEKEESDG